MQHASFLKKNCLILFSLTMALGLAACGQKSDTALKNIPASSAVQTMPATNMGRAKMVNQGAGEQSLTEVSEPTVANAQIVKRYIALRHSLVVETPASQMQAAFDATAAHCEQLKCQVLSANYNRETIYSPPSASLSVRIPPRSIEIFLSGLAKNSEVLQHRRDSEDKTDAVIDADARIKNLTELRDKLRAMLKSLQNSKILLM